MKKNAIVLLAVCSALFSCGKENLSPVPEPEKTPTIIYNLAAHHPDGESTKAVKSGWEDGDAIFVFFNNVASPKHLKMTYNGTAWTSAEYDGATLTPGALGLANGATGSMRAVFLPFGSHLTVSASGGNFVFSKIQYSYYLTATLNYTVTDNTVSGAFDMKVPANYVQFYVEDAEAVDEAYTLGCDAVIPTGIASIASNGSVTETSDKLDSDDMPGYAYQGGYLFSGKLVSSYAYSYNYYFAKTKVLGNSREDYFVSSFSKRLKSHSSIKLPANGNSSWQEVGDQKSVNLRSKTDVDLGTWFTCNFGETVPEGADADNRYDFSYAQTKAGIPTRDQLSNLVNNTTKNAVSIHGQWGYVFAGYNGRFLFIPGQFGDSGGVFSCTEYDSSTAWYMMFNTNTSPSVETTMKYFYNPLRLLDTTAP